MMQFKTMADVEAYYRRRVELAHLHVQAHELCNALCHKLDWRHDPERVERLHRVLARARTRLARRARQE